MLSYPLILGLDRPNPRMPHAVERLVCGKPSDNLLHLLVRVDPEAFLLRHTCQLHILAIQFLLHDLLQGLKNEYLRLG